MVEHSLKTKTIHGVGWTAADTIGRYGVTFVISLVLARLLTPKEYGLIGILSIFINLFNVIVDGGFTNAIIRKQNVKDVDYCTVFYINFVLSVVLAITLFLCARPIAHFFNNSELVALTQVMSSVVVINAIAIVHKARLTKILDFKTQTKIAIISASLSGIMGIIMAIIGYGVWALVGQQITYQLVNTILFWVYNRWCPKLLFSWKSFKELWDFGWKLLVSGILDSLGNELYTVVIGKFYNPQTLGQYTRANQFSSIFSSNLTTIVQRVSFPVLSIIQDDIPRLKSAYRGVIRTTMLPTFVLMLGMAAVAKTMVIVLVGDQWLPCIPFLQIICFYMMLYPLHALNLNAIQVIGRSDLTLKIKIIKTIIGLIPLLLGILFNIYWLLIGSVIANFISYYLNTYYSGPLLKYPIIEQIRDITPSFRVAVIMAIPVYAMSYISLNPFFLLPLQLIVGVAIVFIICEKTKLSEYIELKSMAMTFIAKFKRGK